ncbi:MAG: sigma-54-dependent Fis family transcriptional regulator [Ignavibacteriae bacterium]|nr:sigma-54-dependent Fis family transcriptional regulator [Ignavibacteriota bacterium]
MEKIIVIDDNKTFLETISTYLSELGYETTPADCGKKGLELVKKINPDLVICDITMPDINGLEVLKYIKEIDELIQVIMMTAVDDMNSTIIATQNGAYDYLVKADDLDLNRLKISISRSLENRKMSKRLESVTTDNLKELENNIIIGKSSIIREIYKKIGQASASRVTVLIQGESGTGKELIAKVVHSSGITKNLPFIPLNCTAMPETLLESELFGHVKGSFTDAIKDKRGKFELAGEGTIFLDEISEMSINLQAKLLRVLQEHEFEKVGGETLIPMKARVISATNCDLQKLVEKGKFREDLFYRLSVFSITPPPLRDRREDIELLVKHFIEKINVTLHKTVRKIPDEVMMMLKMHDWKGNVRELENTLMQAIVLSKGDVIEKENILLRQNEVQRGDEGKIGSNVTIEELERMHIKSILEKTNWDIKTTCDILGISKATIYRKIETYNLKQHK